MTGVQRPPNGFPLGSFNETSPVGIPPFPITEISAVMPEPCVKVDWLGVSERFVVVALKLAVFQLFTRLEMFTEPKPVARS